MIDPKIEGHLRRIANSLERIEQHLRPTQICNHNWVNGIDGVTCSECGTMAKGQSFER